MDWFKVYSRKWLYGSGRNMSAEKRGVWADFLALAAETKLRDGTLRFDVGQPMPKEYIAGILRIPMDTLEACLDCFSKDMNADNSLPRVRIWDDGTIELTNFSRYQEKPEKPKKPPMTPEQKIGMQRSLDNKNPDVAKDVLEHDFGYRVTTRKEIVNQEYGQEGKGVNNE